MKTTVTPTEAMGKILSYNSGRFFSVRFIKKDGSLRNMTCKKVVKKRNQRHMGRDTMPWSVVIFLSTT
jgi:hypothetical protein